MRRPIVLTDEIIQKMQEEFGAALRSAKLSDGSVKYEKKFVYPDEEGGGKASVLYTPLAWFKQKMLLDEFSTEVAWHGVVERRNDTTFVIKDILVYPQEVTGGTVNTDQEAYQKWMMELPDDVYNHLRAQMHSHVNFSTNPSSIDLTHQERILDMMGGKDYFVFLIWNKRMEKSVKIYDLENNILYENDDVIVDVIDDGSDLHRLISFVSKSQDFVKTKTTYGAAYSGSAYSGANYGAGKKTAKTETKEPAGKKGAKAAGQQTALTGFNNDHPCVDRIGGYQGGILDRHDRWYQNLVGAGDDLD